MGCCVLLLAALVLGAELAVATAVSIQPDVDPRSFGAVGNGVIDDAPALQAALDACQQGSVLRLPKGRWLLQSETLRLRSGVTLPGVGQNSVLVKGAKPTTALDAVNASNIVVTGVWFAVEASAPAVMEGRLAHFRHCRQVSVRQCSFDGNATNGLPSQFSLCLFECCNDVKCLDNCFSNAAGSATGVTGASWEPGWGHGSEFARNVIEDYCDTGIGLWTGACDAHLHHNRLKGRREKFTSFPVGIDVDGGTHSVIEHNDNADGHIAIRLYDCHDGVYPIEAMVVRENFLHDQRTYDAYHLAWAIKPKNPKSRLEVRFERNRIMQPDPNALAFAGGGAGRTILHVDENEFTGAIFWSFGCYATNALELFSGARTVDWRTGTGNNHWKKP